jgi:hypothetical protein
MFTTSTNNFSNTKITTQDILKIYESLPENPTGIKMKRAFFNMLMINPDVICKEESECNYIDYFRSLKVYIDDTIENDYELVY